jgi:hypothetical protein
LLLEIRKSHQARLNGIFVFKTLILKGWKVAFAEHEVLGTTEGNPSFSAKGNPKRKLWVFLFFSALRSLYMVSMLAQDTHLGSPILEWMGNLSINTSPKQNACL